MSLNLTVLLREAAAAHPSRPALIIGDRSVNYATLHALAQRMGGLLRALGVQPGQHVALLLPNVPQFTISYFGVQYAEAAVVPLNVLLTAEEVRYHLEDSEAVAIVAWEGFYEAARGGAEGAPACKHLILVKADGADLSAPEGAVSFNAKMAAATPISAMPATKPDDTAVILYTSGTTGRAKGAELTHFNLFFNAHYVRTQLLPVGAETVALCTLPLFHSFGQTVIQNAVLGAGGTVVLLPRFTPEDAVALMKKHKVTLFAGVPTMYFALLHHPGLDPNDLSSLTHCVSGGSAMPVEVMRAFDARMKVSILEGYGLSETSPVASFNRLDREKKPGSIGLPIWGCEFQLTDAEGQVITTPDTPGEICIKGHNVMKGYLGRPEATAEVLKEGWFSTGDVGQRDADGFYFIVDRKKDMIIRGGFNVYPREVEEVLYAHPAVAEAAVIGVPDERMGEEVKAVVAFKPGHSATLDELNAHCRAHLAAYKAPRSFEVRAALPKGPTGKILKRELRG
jgi:long-chain acyl-CoA synthetase